MKLLTVLLALICVFSGIFTPTINYLFAIPYLLSFAVLCWIYDKKEKAEQEQEQKPAKDPRKDLTGVNHCDIFYGHILPELSHEFSVCDDFSQFQEIIESRFLINAHQWAEIKDEFYGIKEYK